MIDFDIILCKIGKIGKFQWLVFFLMSLNLVPLGFNALATVFIAYTPDYRCSVFPFDNSSAYPNLSFTEILNLTTPYDEDNKKYLGCFRYGYNLESCNGDHSCVNKSADVIPCDQGYYFDDSLFTETVITEFDLICDRVFYNALSTSFYYVGMLIGSLIFGPLNDKFGRRTTLAFCFVGTLAFMFGTTFSTSVVMYIVFRVITSAFAYGATIGTFVYIMEVVRNEWRTYFGFGYQCFFGLSAMIQSGFSYKWRNWHDMMLACCITTIPLAISFIILPESPRWLFTKNKDKEGRKAVQFIEKLNNVRLSDKDWIDAEVKTKEVAITYSAVDLFRLPRTRLVTLNMMFSWFVSSLVYYGLALNAGSLAGNIFVNNTLNGLMEIFAYFICMFLVNKIGRRLTLSYTMLTAGFGLLISLITLEFSNNSRALEAVSVTFAFIGKAGISGAFAVIYNVTAELFPTVTRSNAVGVGSAAARVGGILAPFIIWLQDSIRWLPNVIFTVFGVSAGLLALLFPETKGFELMETLDEAEEFYKTKTQAKNKKEVNNESYADNPGFVGSSNDCSESGENQNEQKYDLSPL